MSDQAMDETNPDGILGWVAAGVVSIIAALTTAVMSMFKMQRDDSRDQLAKSEQRSVAMIAEHRAELSRLDQIENELRKEIADCKLDREELRVRLGRQEVELELLKARISAVEKQ